MRRHEITEEQWKRIKNILPPERKKQGGRPAKDNRQMINAMLYWLNTGVPWRDLPERFGSWKSVYTRFKRWKEESIFEKLLKELIKLKCVDKSTLMLDSTTVRVHQHAAVIKKGRKKKPDVPGED